MKKSIVLCALVFLVLFSSCQSPSLTETEITPDNRPYIGLLCDQNDNVHCFVIQSVENYLDTYFTEKEVFHYTLGTEDSWSVDTCEWLNIIANDFPNINGKVYNIALTYHQDAIYCVAAMGEYKDDYYYGDKNVLYVIKDDKVVKKKELHLPTYKEGKAIPYAPKMFVTNQYIALHTVAGVCLLDQDGKLLVDQYPVAKIDAITDDIALAEYNADYVEILKLPTLESQGLFKAKDSYMAYPKDTNVFFTFTTKGIYRYSIKGKDENLSEILFMDSENFHLSNENADIMGGAVSQGNICYVIMCDAEKNFHLYRYSNKQ